MTTIVQAQGEDEIEAVRRLMQAFESWRRVRQPDQGSASNHRSAQAPLEVELAQLPRPDAPPRGSLLLAYEADQPAGSAALRDLGTGDCEVAWLFVSAHFRGQRVGRALMARLLLEAKAAGYQRMRLDTHIHEVDAMHLCERAGFRRIDVDPDASDTGPNQHVFFEQELRPVG